MVRNNETADHFRAVFISPHLDDAVLSCGGTIAQIAEQGPVLVVNVFTHYPSTFQKGAIKVSPNRYAEEGDAANLLGYRSLNIGETDAIFRETIRGSAARLFLAPNESTSSQLDAVRQRLDGLLDALHFDELYLPMGIGWHIDHILCHLATCHRLQAENVFLYEDAPYCLIPNATRYRIHEIGSPPTRLSFVSPTYGTLVRDWWYTSRSYVHTRPIAAIRPCALRMLGSVVVAGYLGFLMSRHIPRPGHNREHLAAHTNDISDTFEKKTAASFLYESQISEFFFSRADYIDRYRQYSKELGLPGRFYERFWNVSKPM